MFRAFSPIITPVFGSGSASECTNFPMFGPVAFARQAKLDNSRVLFDEFVNYASFTQTSMADVGSQIGGCELINYERYVATVSALFNTMVYDIGVCWKTQGELRHACSGAVDTPQYSELEIGTDVPIIDHPSAPTPYKEIDPDVYKTKVSEKQNEGRTCFNCPLICRAKELDDNFDDGVFAVEWEEGISWGWNTSLVDPTTDYPTNHIDYNLKPSEVKKFDSDEWAYDNFEYVNPDIQFCGCNNPRAHYNPTDETRIRHGFYDDQEDAFELTQYVLQLPSGAKPYFVIALEWSVDNSYITENEKNTIIDLFYEMDSYSQYQFSLPTTPLFDFDVDEGSVCTNPSGVDFVNAALVKSLRGIVAFNDDKKSVKDSAPVKYSSYPNEPPNKTFVPTTWTDSTIVTPIFGKTEDEHGEEKDDPNNLTNPPTFDSDGKQNGGATLIKDIHFLEPLYYGSVFPIVGIDSSATTIKKFDLYSIFNGDDPDWKSTTVKYDTFSEYHFSNNGIKSSIVSHGWVHTEYCGIMGTEDFMYHSFEYNEPNTFAFWWLNNNNEVVLCSDNGYVVAVGSTSTSGVSPSTPADGIYGYNGFSADYYITASGLTAGSKSPPVLRNTSQIIEMPSGITFNMSAMASTMSPGESLSNNGEVGSLIAIQDARDEFNGMRTIWMDLGFVDSVTTDSTVRLPSAGGILNIPSGLDVNSVIYSFIPVKTSYSLSSSEENTQRQSRTFYGEIFLYCSDYKVYKTDIELLSGLITDCIYVVDGNQSDCSENRIIDVGTSSSSTTVILFKFDEDYHGMRMAGLMPHIYVAESEFSEGLVDYTMYRIDEPWTTSSEINFDSMSKTELERATATVPDLRFQRLREQTSVRVATEHSLNANGYAIKIEGSELSDETKKLKIKLLDVLFNFAESATTFFVPVKVSLGDSYSLGWNAKYICASSAEMFDYDVTVEEDPNSQLPLPISSGVSAGKVGGILRDHGEGALAWFERHDGGQGVRPPGTQHYYIGSVLPFQMSIEPGDASVIMRSVHDQTGSEQYPNDMRVDIIYRDFDPVGNETLVTLKAMSQQLDIRSKTPALDFEDSLDLTISIDNQTEPYVWWTELEVVGTWSRPLYPWEPGYPGTMFFRDCIPREIRWLFCGGATRLQALYWDDDAGRYKSPVFLMRGEKMNKTNDELVYVVA